MYIVYLSLSLSVAVSMSPAYTIYILHVIVDDFFRCNELRRFVSCFYPSQALMR